MIAISLETSSAIGLANLGSQAALDDVAPAIIASSKAAATDTSLIFFPLCWRSPHRLGGSGSGIVRAAPALYPDDGPAGSFCRHGRGCLTEPVGSRGRSGHLDPDEIGRPEARAQLGQHDLV